MYALTVGKFHLYEFTWGVIKYEPRRMAWFRYEVACGLNSN
jgi:hypothetical protein